MILDIFMTVTTVLAAAVIVVFLQKRGEGKEARLNGRERSLELDRAGDRSVLLEDAVEWIVHVRARDDMLPFLTDGEREDARAITDRLRRIHRGEITR